MVEIRIATVNLRNTDIVLKVFINLNSSEKCQIISSLDNRTAPCLDFSKFYKALLKTEIVHAV